MSAGRAPGGDRGARERSPAGPAHEGDPPLLEVRDLRTYFRTERGEARAVDGVSFRLRPGETLGLVGESGCGKSVTALSLLRLLPEDTATLEPGSSVRLRGEELTTADERRMRDVRGGEIAMIFQEPMSSLNPVLTVGEQIVEGIREHARVGKEEARREAVRLLERVELADPAERLDAYPHQLSGGQRQRVMIAMALGCRPSILVADEPTTALDVTVQAQILSLLGSLQEETGMAVLFITHDLGVVAETADRVAVMYAGRIVETGSVEAIFRSATHPYTRGLLAALPDPERPTGRLRSIGGEVPDPTRWPAGCRFHPRCPHAWDRCRREEPTLLEADEGRTRCWLVEEPDRRGEVAAGDGHDAERGEGP